MPFPIQVGAATVTIHRDDRVLVCQPDGRIETGAEEGFFARDTRFVSGWGMRINGRRPLLLNSSPVEAHSARFEFTNALLRDERGEIEARSLSIRLDRTLSGGVHEDLGIVNHGRRPVRLTVEVELTSDFADIFDVKSGQLVRRGSIDSRWFPSRRELRTRYVNGSFARALVVVVGRTGSAPHFANGRLGFVASVEPKGEWHVCLRWLPVMGGTGPRPETLPCHALRDGVGGREPGERRHARLVAGDPDLVRTWDQSISDLEALRLEDLSIGEGVVIPAAGVPWFLTLFGRDSLIVSMQAMAGFPEFARGALHRLSQLQAERDDPERDMEPGKIAHEIRHGEVAELDILPFQPYYGTHDASTLFITTLARLHDWTAEAGLLERFLPNATAAMRWADEWGDRDGDGLQEYATRSQHGYYNQGWKDAGDAVPHADGALAPLPIALCELQGYLHEAKLRLAGMLELCDRPEDAERLRDEARRIHERVNDAFWWESEGTYYLGLDGEKQPIRSVASNAGHLLASGIVPPDRARRVASRLLQEDLWSGWGIRTLSSEHVAYNPFSYHTGSVWPHDNAIIAAGFRRYGLDAEAATVARGIFDAAARFLGHRLPELFAGLTRETGSFPVQYLGANVPQAWAAGAVVQLVLVLAGIEARSAADANRLHIDPALPDWLPRLEIHGLRAGSGRFSVALDGSDVTVLANETGFEIVSRKIPGRDPHG
jgi:glycogen debranching enzyme